MDPSESGSNVPANDYASLPRDVLFELSGLELLQAMIAGRLAPPPIAGTLDFGLKAAEHGRVVFEGRPGAQHYNPLGTVHGGYMATLLDSCMGCAVHSTLAKGQGYTTLEFKINFTRPVTDRTGPVLAEGRVLSGGRRAATAEGFLRDRDGKLLAHATTTCLIFDL